MSTYHEYIRNIDGVVEHAVFTSQLDGTVIVSLEVMNDMLLGLGFRPVDTVTAEVVESETTTTEG
jgi:hypothetical protein